MSLRGQKYKFAGSREFKADRDHNTRKGILIFREGDPKVRGYYVREEGLVSTTETPVMRYNGLHEESWPKNSVIRFEEGYWVIRASRMRGKLLEDPDRRKVLFFKEDQDYGDAT